MAGTENEAYWNARRVVGNGDVAKVDAFFRENPGLLTALDPLDKTNWLQYAAAKENVQLVRYFVEKGVPVNVTDESGVAPLTEIARLRDFDTAKWLIEKGADPNISHWPMISAVSAGSLEIVKLFVEHGAEFTFTFGDPPRTPLSQAIDYGHPEVAEYLRSVGAKGLPESETPAAEAGEPDDDVVVLQTALSEEEQHQEIIDYFIDVTGGKPNRFGVQELIPGRVSVSVWTITRKDYHLIFTTGMSTRAMRVPEEPEQFQHAELVMVLPKKWPKRPKLDDPRSWPWRWLRIMAHYPHEHDTWLGGPYSTFANGDPPKPLETGCEFTAFLLAYGRHYDGFRSADGRAVKIITTMPIYTEEWQLARQKDGFYYLGQRFDEISIGPVLYPGRPNAGS